MVYTRRSWRLPATFLALTIGAGVQLGSLEVQAQAILSVGGCRGRLARVHKRHRCIACVRSGRVYHKRGGGHGHCGAPRAVPVPRVGGDRVLTAHGCEQRIGRLTKRRRCIACVRSGRVFHKRGAAHGHCGGAKRLPKPRVVGDALLSVNGCESHVARIPKRKRCIACVGRGRVFHQRGAGHGYCGARKGTPPRIHTGGRVLTAAGCETRVVRAGKRRRCIACVRGGRVFHQRGAGHGFCGGPKAAPPPPRGVGKVRSARGCETRVGRLSKRRRCIACVRRGGVFIKQGAAAGFCTGGRVTAPPPRVVPGQRIRSPHGCRSRVRIPSKRRRCVACVRRGGVFHKQGGGAGFCR